MGTITVNVDDKTETKFRETVKEVVGTGKGKLGSAISEAMKKWVNEKRQDEIAQRQIKLLDKGFDMGSLNYKHRDELHDRSL
jgi:hypothetical protein